MAVYADTLPVPVDDPNGRAGWLYKKTGGTEKLNYYFYSQGSTPLLLKNLKDVYFVGIIDNWVNADSAAYVAIYTKPLGDGQDGGAWYRTRQTFRIHTGAHITLGMRTQFTTSGNPSPAFPFEKIRLTQLDVVGPNDPDEEIYTISVQTDSTAANTTAVLISHVGYSADDGRHSLANPNILLGA